MIRWILFAVFLLWLLSALIASITPAGAQVEPYPTQSATSWVATPTSWIAPPPVYQSIVYLPLIGKGE